MSPDALAALQVQAVAPSTGAAVAAPARLVEPQPAADAFGRLVTEGIGEVNRQLVTSQGDLQRLAAGDVQNLHQIMVRLEESRLSFQLLLQVRNRLLEAYQDVMKMQV